LVLEKGRRTGKTEVGDILDTFDSSTKLERRRDLPDMRPAGRLRPWRKEGTA